MRECFSAFHRTVRNSDAFGVLCGKVRDTQFNHLASPNEQHMLLPEILMNESEPVVPVVNLKLLFV